MTILLQSNILLPCKKYDKLNNSDYTALGRQLVLICYCIIPGEIASLFFKLMVSCRPLWPCTSDLPASTSVSWDYRREPPYVALKLCFINSKWWSVNCSKALNILWQGFLTLSLCMFFPHHLFFIIYICLCISANLFDAVFETDLHTYESILLLSLCQMLYEAINQPMELIIQSKNVLTFFPW